MMDSKIPNNERANAIKLSNKKFARKNKELIRNKINNIFNEYFIILNAYTGITFSFQ